MRKRNRRWHQLRRFVAGKTKHEPLITRALFGGAFAFRRCLIDTLFNIARLLRDFAYDPTGIGVKNAIIVHITNAADCVANLVGEIEARVTRDLAGQHDEIALGQCFARDAAERVLLETSIENVIADGVANLIGMTFGYRFGGKNKTTRHGEILKR